MDSDATSDIEMISISAGCYTERMKSKKGALTSFAYFDNCYVIAG